MKANDVVDMAQYRGSRNALASIMEKLAAASWISAAEFWKAHSEVTVYLCDSNAETVVVFHANALIWRRCTLECQYGNTLYDRLM